MHGSRLPLATEVARDGITVNTVQPGPHLTNRVAEVFRDGIADRLGDIPAGRAGDPDHFGAVVTFLCSHHADYVTGVALPVDGGESRGLL